LILSDRDIRKQIDSGRLVIRSTPTLGQPSSVDLRVDDQFRVFANLQLCLFEITSPAERPYGERGKYQGQRGFHQDFDRGSEGSLSEEEDRS
jgi:deoxycytidine triphosphate deaminase